MKFPASLENLHIWLPGYLATWRTTRRESGIENVWLAITDHYEPYWRGADHGTALARVREWHTIWPQIAARHQDSAGRPPRYTFFYAEEEYHREALSLLSELTTEGTADVEVHIHHDGEGEHNFVTRMRRFIEVLHLRHGLLREKQGKVAFGFIHGNWALDNSRPDGRMCGLNNELTLLKELGCYADFTLPSAPHATQTSMVNTIYWATDDPERSKSHDRGTPVVPGGAIEGDLLIVPGPLGWNLRGPRRWLPRLETGELATYDPPTAVRARSWLDLAPRIGLNRFVKLFSHGTQEANARALLDGGLDRCFDDMRAECARRGYRLYYCSAWEMALAIDAVRRQVDPVTEVLNTVRSQPAV